MKTKKRMILWGIIMLLFCTLFAACTAGDDGEILLVVRRSNDAEEFQDDGYVIDTQGRIFSYKNETPRPLDGEDGEELSLAEYLEVIRENYDGEPVFDEEFVQKIMELGADLSQKDEFTESHKMCDDGQNTIYYFNPKKRKLLQCQSTGDVDQIPQNKSAAKIVELLEEKIGKNSKEVEESEKNDIHVVYPARECFVKEFVNYGVEYWVGKWILKDEESLERFGDMSDIQFLYQLLEVYGEGTVFFVTIEKACEGESVRRPKAFCVCGERSDFVYDCKKTNETDHYICSVVAVDGNNLPGDLEKVTDFEGNPWTVFNADQAPITYIDDGMTIEFARDKEFYVMRTGDALSVLPGADPMVYLDDCDDELKISDGQILRVVADVDIYYGGEDGYWGDYFPRKVKKKKKVSYDEILKIMDFPNAEEASFKYGEYALTYRKGDRTYFVVMYRNYINAYLDGELVLQYEYDKEKDELAPFYKFVESQAGSDERMD